MANGLRSEAYDLVHVQGMRFARAGGRLARRLDLPWVLGVSEPPQSRSSLPLRDPRFRGFIATSQEIREDLVNTHRVPRDRIRVVGPGVDLHWFAPAPAFARLDERVPVCGMVSHLDARAGVEVLIDAAKQALSAGEELHFLVAGDGPDGRRLRRLAWRRGVANRITFVPPETDYRLLLRSFDLCVSPKLDEGLRLSVLEAMATGRPVIAAAAGSVFSMVREGETGLLVPPGDAAALAKAMLGLIRDPERARQLGDAGRSWVAENYNLTERVTELVDVYRRALSD
jgi:glycosyltransferase involved in cell wall biosynthesis